MLQLAPAAPACGHTTCTDTAVVHWTRLPTAGELANVPADQQADAVVLVYACGTHAIGLEAAALVHHSTCSGPNAAALPACDCTPVQPPQPAALDLTTLASGWQIAN